MCQEDVSALARALFGVPQGGVVHERTLAPPLPKPLPPLPRPDMLLVGGGIRNETSRDDFVVVYVLVQCSKSFRRMTPSLDPRAESFPKKVMPSPTDTTRQQHFLVTSELTQLK